MQKDKLNKGDLSEAVEVSNYTMGKLYREEPVLWDMMMFCTIIHSSIADFVKITKED